MRKEDIRQLEESVFKFNIKRDIDNSTKTDEEINGKYLKGEVRIAR